MRSINTLSLTPNANDWLADTRHPRILHVFDHACNLINERREVLSIVTQQIGNGPFNLVVVDGAHFTKHLSPQSQISNSLTHLRLGDLIIGLDNAKLWSPRPDWESLHGRRDEILNQVVSLPIIEHFEYGGFDTPLDDRSGLLNHRHLQITNYQFPNSPISNSLSSALANADLFSSLTAVQKLAGLGVGLTPAGDDFILGAILAAWIIHLPEIASVLAEEITNTAAPLTTSLSAAWLRSVGRGDAGVLWHNFFDALISADPVRIQTALDKILAVGETSGADALAGFMSIFISYAESKTKLCHS